MIKTGLVPNEIYVFTPNGDIVELPKDSTPIDFAFAVHSDIGLHCKGCRINKNLAPLSVPLESGQTINIITDKYPQANPTWLEFVRTSRARSAIRNSTKNLKASKARKYGKNLLEQSLEPHRIKLRNVPKARMSKLLDAINVKSVRELLEQIGSGQRSSLVVAHQIIQFLDYDQKDLIEFSNIQISGSEGLVLSYAACCKPIPGDNIIAHFSNQKGIVIHTERCKNMTALRKDPAHCAPVQWEKDVIGDFSVEIKIISDDRPGLLAEISASISEAGSNIVNFRMDPPAGSSIQMYVVIEVKDRQHLAKIMRRLRRLNHVMSVSRIHNQDQKIRISSQMKKIISTDSAPSAIGTYSQAVLINNFLYVSGQIALDPKNMKMVEGIDNQIEMVFKNIKEILKEAEMDFSNVIKLTILLDNLENFEKVNEIMSELFEKPYPARAAFEVSKLPKNSSIEVETIAYKGSAK